MLSGAAWKDTVSSSVGGPGPYIPKLLLGRIDSEEERETRRQFYQKQKKEQRTQNYMAAVKLLQKGKTISDVVAQELESKVHDEGGIALFEMVLQKHSCLRLCRFFPLQ